MTSSASVVARVAGAIGALGYLTGLVESPVIGALAGLSLVALGRSLVVARGSELFGPVCFGILAGAAGSVVLRWGSLDLPEIQGAQGVLGPTVLVEPVAVAVANGSALIASTAVLGLWLMARPERPEALPRWWGIESAAGALLIATLFVGPAPSGAGQAAIWLGAAGLIAGVGLLIGRVATSFRVRWIVVGVCGAVVTASAAITGAVA